MSQSSEVGGDALVLGLLDMLSWLVISSVVVHDHLTQGEQGMGGISGAAPQQEPDTQHVSHLSVFVAVARLLTCHALICWGTLLLLAAHISSQRCPRLLRQATLYQQQAPIAQQPGNTWFAQQPGNTWVLLVATMACKAAVLLVRVQVWPVGSVPPLIEPGLALAVSAGLLITACQLGAAHVSRKATILAHVSAQCASERHVSAM
jgi:hypothetical protein